MCVCRVFLFGGVKINLGGAKIILASGKIILGGSKIILASGKIYLGGAKIILASGKIIMAGLVTDRQSHPVQAREFLNNGM